MAKILILGESGSGKSTSIGNIPELGIEGLKPEETFIIACSNKGLPFAGWKRNYPKISGTDTATGNYVVADSGETVANIIRVLGTKPNIKNIIIDDSNYIMQDYYMENSSTGGFKVFNNIGAMMSKIFRAMETIGSDKNVIMMAHYEEFRAKNNDKLSFRFKTVGNMVRNYITPEGKFEIVLFADQEYDSDNKKVTKRFVTNYDGEYPAKTPIGMFKELYIPNDLGYVTKRVDEYYNDTPSN